MFQSLPCTTIMLYNLGRGYFQLNVRIIRFRITNKVCIKINLTQSIDFVLIVVDVVTFTYDKYYFLSLCLIHAVIGIFHLLIIYVFHFLSSFQQIPIQSEVAIIRRGRKVVTDIARGYILITFLLVYFDCKFT